MSESNGTTVSNYMSEPNESTVSSQKERPSFLEHPTTIRMDPALKRELRAYAAKQGASLSWFITDILRKWLSWRKAQK